MPAVLPTPAARGIVVESGQSEASARLVAVFLANLQTTAPLRVVPRATAEAAAAARGSRQLLPCLRPPLTGPRWPDWKPARE